jgi:hypothetical protein
MEASGTRQGRDGQLRDPMIWPPEFPVALFSFLLHFVWEFLQVPAFAGLAEMPHWEAVKLCARATVGDVGMALTAFWAACLTAATRGWLLRPRSSQVAIFLGAGIALTIGFEYHAINIGGRWAYSEAMPLVPPFGTGLSPLMQWVVIPPVVIWLSRRHLLGSRAIREAEK